MEPYSCLKAFDELAQALLHTLMGTVLKTATTRSVCALLGPPPALSPS